MKKWIIPLIVTFVLSFISTQVMFQVQAINQFSTPATIVVGQPDFDECSVSQNQGSTGKGLNFPFSLPRVYDGKLILPTGNDNRVKIYNTVPTENDPMPDLTLGTYSKCLTQGGPVQLSSDRIFWGVVNTFYDGQRFFVVERSRSRVAVYNNGIPTEQFAPADYVIGQPDFTSA